MTLPRAHYFNPESDPLLYRCPCLACAHGPSPRLITTLDQVRHVAGIPFHVTSGPRCHAHNKKVGGSEFSEHIDGDGADIACADSRSRFLIVNAAIQEGVTRIGIAKSFIHLGVSETNDQHVIWTYS